MKKVMKKLQALIATRARAALKIKMKNDTHLRGAFIPVPNESSNGRLVPLMKILLITLMVSGFSVSQSNGQMKKGIKEKVDKKVEQRADKKVDKSIDKALDNTENEVEKSLKASTAEKNKEAGAMANGNPPSAETTEVPSTARVADGLVMVSGDCNDFIWFKTGSMMKFEAQDGKGKTLN